jgi:hypothetical protein
MQANYETIVVFTTLVDLARYHGPERRDGKNAWIQIHFSRRSRQKILQRRAFNLLFEQRLLILQDLKEIQHWVIRFPALANSTHLYQRRWRSSLWRISLKCLDSWRWGWTSRKHRCFNLCRKRVF